MITSADEESTRKYLDFPVKFQLILLWLNRHDQRFKVKYQINLPLLPVMNETPLS